MAFFLALLFQAATAAAPAVVAQAPTPPEDLRIVCKTVNGTGTRLNTQRLCMPKREWQRMWDNGRETTSSMQDRNSNRDPSSR